MNPSRQNYHLTAASQARNSAGELPDATTAYLPDDQYKIHQQAEERPFDV